MQSGAWLTSVALERWAPALLIVFLPPPHLLYFIPRCKDNGWVSRFLIAAPGRVQLHCEIWRKKFVSSVGLLLKWISRPAQVFLVISDNEPNDSDKTASRCWGAAACHPNWPDNNNDHHDEPTSAPLHRRKEEVSLTFLCCFSHAGSRRRSRSQSSSWCI